MAAHTYPWRNDQTIEQVLAACRRWLVDTKTVADRPGYSEDEVAADEKRLGRPLPQEVRTFYRAMYPVNRINDGPVGHTMFDEPDLLQWHSMSAFEEEPTPDWVHAEGLRIGNMVGAHSALYWLRGHRTHPDGSIVLYDPEYYLRQVGLADRGLFVVARSLKEFIAKLAVLSGLSPGSCDKDEDDWDEETQQWGWEIEESDRWRGRTGLTRDEARRLFLAEYAELNPATSRQSA